MTPIAHWIAPALVIGYSSYLIFKIINDKPLDKADRLMVAWVLFQNVLAWVMLILSYAERQQ